MSVEKVTQLMLVAVQLAERIPPILDLYSTFMTRKTKLLDTLGLNQLGVEDFLSEQDGYLEGAPSRRTRGYEKS